MLSSLILFQSNGIGLRFPKIFFKILYHIQGQIPLPNVNFDHLEKRWQGEPDIIRDDAKSVKVTWFWFRSVFSFFFSLVIFESVWLTTFSSFCIFVWSLFLFIFREECSVFKFLSLSRVVNLSLDTCNASTNAALSLTSISFNFQSFIFFL